MHWTIYILKDPRTLEIRYVGKTVLHIDKRLQEHVAEAQKSQKTYKQRGIFSLLRIGLFPLIEAIETGAGNNWAEAECRWLAFHRANGARLWNATDGGEGVVGLTREQFSARGRRREANMTFQQRSTRAKKVWVSKTPQQRSEQAKRAIASQTPEQLSERSKKANAGMTSDQRSAATVHSVHWTCCLLGYKGFMEEHLRL